MLAWLIIRIHVWCVVCMDIFIFNKKKMLMWYTTAARILCNQGECARATAVANLISVYIGSPQQLYSDTPSENISVQYYSRKEYLLYIPKHY